MATVELSEVPAAGDDLEDYVAALFQAAGFFVEKNVTHRDPKDILELDLVATDYSGPQPSSILCEAKGGDWGWSDAFKVAGWMTYLDLDRGAMFVTSDQDNDIEKMNAKLDPLGISVTHFGDFGQAVATFEASGFGTIADDTLVSLWRHSYAIERALTRFVRKTTKNNAALKGPHDILAYHRLINDGLFFTESPVDQLSKLYDAYKQHPKITLACAVELQGGEYDPHCAPTTSQLLNDAMRAGEHPILQAAMYVEHRARLAILRAAVTYCCEHPDGPPVLAKNELNWDHLHYYSLPNTLQQGMDWLWKQPTFRRYALFWQQFMWGYGGFYLDDREQAEFEWMSKWSGIPAAEIPNALQAYDRFFPIGEWLVAPGWTCAKRVKMVPVYFEGLGAHYRRVVYGLGPHLNALKSSGYTVSDLVTWNNAAVEFLLAN